MARNRFNSGTSPEQELNKAKINKQTIKTASGLLSYLRPYRWKFVLGLVFLLLSSLTGLAFPALLGAMIDVAKGESPRWFIPDSINAIGVVSFVILFFQSFVSFFRIRLFVEVAEKTIADIRRNTYFKLITLPMDFFASRRVGELNSRLSADLSQIQDTITTTLAEMVRQIILLVGGITFLIIVSPKLTLFNLAILPVLVLSAVLFGKKIRKISRQAQDRLADSNIVVEETLHGISSVKAFANEAYEANRYDKSLREVVKIALKGATLRGGFASFIIFCLFGAIVAVIWFGSLLVADGSITIGSLTTYIIYSMFVGAAMGTFPELYANVQKALGATERIIEILNENNEPVSINAADNVSKSLLKGNLTFKKVRFSYTSRKEITVLHDVSFEAKAGQRIALVGPSGAGKSTIASLILRFYEPTEGEILFDGKPSNLYPLTDIRNQIAIVPQDVLLFGGSIRENIAYGKLTASQDEIIAAAKQANAHNFIMALPEGYETLVGERGIKLSGGQRQRIAIARALLKDPAILILDEATSSLDSESERLVQEALEVLMKNRTSIIIAHRLSTVREADSILVLEKGSVVESGSHTELLKNENGLYKYLSNLQFEA
ncbi:ABC transporter fused permease/ATP-binding protein [Arcticibacter pallidicorallinus]|uniref:ABC transporter fused permease/ATP-binding protein n=1 Tax=Arcticibacter pallidicorallinus TaxID=1259464 RepID=A0A2T0U3C6_9SPHI|nr:ABC transporter transmembrane domain-containing protein [Arcticibacter pallidicorallinus]PRY52400.1 ABC transporter fused permease/ATP-binding protein [Arcticibacter pallidicorallinus]